MVVVCYRHYQRRFAIVVTNIRLRLKLEENYCMLCRGELSNFVEGRLTFRVTCVDIGAEIDEGLEEERLICRILRSTLQRAAFPYS